MHPAARDWYVRCTSRARDWPAELISAHKQDTTVAVVLPALNEAATVGTIVEQIVRLRERPRLVDEVVVIDSGSTDDTAAVALRAGAEVLGQGDVLPSLGRRPGKGEALWSAGFATSADIIVFVDSDLSGFRPHYISGLLGPLLTSPELAMVKGFYDRSPREAMLDGGGRVTELLARPVLNALFPMLGGVVQPLAGLQAARRSLLERLPFAAGYGVDVGLLIDAVATVGIDGLAQVGLGRTDHRHHELAALGRMSAAVFYAIYSRASPAMPLWPTLTQFGLEHGIPEPVDHELHRPDRPAWLSIETYASRREAAALGTFNSTVRGRPPSSPAGAGQEPPGYGTRGGDHGSQVRATGHRQLGGADTRRGACAAS